LTGSAARKNCGRIVWAQNLFTILPQFFHNSSTILPRRAARGGAAISFNNYFYNYSPLAVYPSKETKIIRQFCGRIVEEFGACEIGGRIFLSTAD
jgi:hypothetical protein